MSIATAPLMTAEEFIRDYANADGFELDRGQLVRNPIATGKHVASAGMLMQSSANS